MKITMFFIKSHDSYPCRLERLADQRHRLLLQTLQVLRADVGLGVDLVDILCAGGTGCKPALVGGHFQAADRGLMAGVRAGLHVDQWPRSSSGSIEQNAPH